MNKMNSNYIKIILMVSFLEGASVMGVELIGAKLIAPWFGTSLYVWTSVLGVSMLGLASGYYIGGHLSYRQAQGNLLKKLLLLATLFVGVMPLTATLIMSATQMVDVRLGSLIASIVFIFPPLLLMGMVSPMIIRYCTREKTHTGKIAGSVFAASTIGGVLSVLLSGFYFIPLLGLNYASWLFAGLMLIATGVAHFASRYKC